MNKPRTCRLIKSVKKEIQWIEFKMPDDREIRVLIRDDGSGNNKRVKAIIDCPADIKINFAYDEPVDDNDNFGNK